MLSLVLPKGSLEKATLDLFDAADLTVRRASDRDYHASIDDPRIDRVRFLRPQEIPSYLERGLFDIGITGRDWITETQADVVSLGELQYSKATSNPVRVVLAVPDGAPWRSVADLPEGIRISTEFPSLTERFLAEHGVKAMIVPSYGATEAKVPDIVDAIVDLTETGSSLRKNGLRILETLLTSYTELVACPAAYADPDKRAAMEDIALLLRGAIQARGQVLLKLNVAADKLAAVTAMLPAMSSPTVTTLANTGMNAVETVVPKRGVNTLIPALKAAGAQRHPGDPDLQDRRVAAGAATAQHGTRPSRRPGRARAAAARPGCCRRGDRRSGSPSAARLEPGETLAEAAAGRCARRSGSRSSPRARRAARTTVIRYIAFGVLPVAQYQTYFAVAVDDAELSFAHQDRDLSA